ncbi:Transcription factor-like 5 protein [Saguinus oedipus]|uniref:Transcription factor-like 5 protein n=1 Tax=Saguinus oedipus TaxID=9490 RepID=A0ABQ9VMA8_SAGOE|nr:Transcription factor-like 5 protein [Saguinus oedipus]
MSGPGPREPPPEAGAAGGEAGAEGAGGGDAAPGEPGLSFTTTDLSLVEMTEVEYTQLQHILYSHMEAAADGELETRLNSALLAAAGPGAGGFAAGGLGAAAPVYPVLCPPALAADAPCLGHIDFQELRMMLLSEAGAVEKTPGGGDGARARADGAAKEGVSAGAAGPEAAPEARAKPAVRVRLEDRFNSIPAEPPPAPRGAEPPEPGVALNKCVPGGRGLAGPGLPSGPHRARTPPGLGPPRKAVCAVRAPGSRYFRELNTPRVAPPGEWGRARRTPGNRVLRWHS